MSDDVEKPTIELFREWIKLSQLWVERNRRTITHQEIERMKYVDRVFLGIDARAWLLNQYDKLNSRHDKMKLQIAAECFCIIGSQDVCEMHRILLRDDAEAANAK